MSGWRQMRKECRWREERWVEGVEGPIRKGRIMSAIHFVPVCQNSRQQQHEHSDGSLCFSLWKESRS